MHTQQLITQQATEAEREKDLAIRLGRIAGVADPARRVAPDMPATVRYGDPNLAALYERQARNDLLEEVVTKLESVEVDTEDAPITSLEEVEGIGEDLAEKLREAGIYTVDDLARASEEDLVAIDGVGPAKARKLKQSV